MPTERRRLFRVPVQMFLNEYVRETPGRALAMNLSDTGMFVGRVLGPLARPDASVQMEFALPGTSEVIWAAGEVRYDVLDDAFHGTGVRFVAMAGRHARLIRDYVGHLRAEHLRRLLERIRLRRGG
jgi:hypothetical protein